MVLLTHHIKRRGPVLLWAVVIYGAATVGFGLSRSFWISFACLAMTGAADTVSVVIRNLVRQLETPDHLRGRMLGVNMVFVRGGPELGELEAGAVANWIGAPLAVVTGGLGCLVATGWLASSTPELRRYRAEPRSHHRGRRRGLGSVSPKADLKVGLYKALHIFSQRGRRGRPSGRPACVRTKHVRTKHSPRRCAPV